MKLAFTVTALLLAGCAGFPEQPPAPVKTALVARPNAPTTADELVAYIARLRALDEATLSLETTRQREFARHTPSELARLKLALALAAAPQGDESDVLALVDPLARPGGSKDADVNAMASFLQGMVIERRRLKESASAAGAKAREDRKAWESQKQRADTLQERNAQLQQKLDALTDLEKSLSSRKTTGN
jgi:hypothetical protein